MNPTVGDGGTPDEDEVGVVEVAHRLHMAVATVARWAHSGRIPSTRTSTGEIHFRFEDVAAVSVTPAE